MPPEGRVIWGARLVALAYAVHLLSSIRAILGVITGQMHAAAASNPDTLSMWAVTLSASWSFTALAIALFALPTGALWAIVAACIPIFITGVPRVLTDPACNVNIMSVHGCHTFVVTEFIALIGLMVVVSGIVPRLRRSAPAR
jgi:hypothetical protein